MYSQATYDTPSGVQLTSIGLNGTGSTTQYQYDNLFRPTNTIYPDGGGATATYRIYTSSSSPTQMTVAARHATGSTIQTTYTFDGYGRQLLKSVPDGANTDTVQYAYDSNGNASSVTNPSRSSTDPISGTTVSSFDTLGRVTSVLEADGSTASTTYASNTQTVSDEQNKQKKYVYDGLGRLSQLLEPDASGALNWVTQYLYNQNYGVYSSGTYQTIVQQKGGSTDSTQWRTRTFTTDQQGRTVAESTPESGTTTFTYGSPYASANQTLPSTRTDQAGITTTYTYDVLSRLIGKSYSTTTPATAPVSYFYDQSSANGLTIANGLGQRTSMTDGSGQTAWSYDANGRITTIRKTISGVTAQSRVTYNQDSTVAQLTDFGGDTLTYTYDANARQTGVSDPTHTYASGANYNAANQLTGLTNQINSAGALYTRNLGYNNRLQPLTIASTVGSSSIQNLTYGYTAPPHNNGNIATITNGLDSSRSQSYWYDNVNRLTFGGDTTHWGEIYTYDPWGNMTARTLTQGSGYNWSVSVPMPSNQLPASMATYDADGRMTLDPQGHHFTYDAEGRLLAAGTGNYLYDGDGYRVSKTAGGSTTLYWPSGMAGIMNESNAAGTSFAKQIYLAGVQVWTEDIAGTGKVLLQDHLGSTRLAASPTGTVLDDLDYRPFGDVVANYGASPSDNHYLFTGTESDAAESGSDYATFRNLTTPTARFTRPDPYDGSYNPANPQSFNRYAYVGNNPLSFIDPFGLDDCSNGDSAELKHGTSMFHAMSDPNCVVIPDAGGSIAVYIPDPMAEFTLDLDAFSTELLLYQEYVSVITQRAPNNGQEPPPACQAKILNATNNQFGTNYTNSNVTNTFNYSTGAGPGQGTLNLNISGSTAGVSTGYYPVNWWTYIIGYGPTLHVVSGPGGHGGLDSQQTLPFGPNQGTFHIDSGYPINPIGAAFHWLLNMTKAGGYPKC